MEHLKTNLQTLSDKELQRRFEALLLDTERFDEQDMHLIDLYEEEFRRREQRQNEPVQTTEASLAAFKEKYRDLFSEDVTYHRRIRPAKILLVAAIISIICAFTVIQASGIDLSKYIARWTENTFRFVERTQQAEIDPRLEPLMEMMLRYDSDANNIPRYLPSGFTQYSLRDEAGELITATYMSGEETLVISYNRKKNMQLEYEKNKEPPEEYVRGETTFYIMQNMDSYLCVWQKGEWECAIFGVSSREDLLKMIDSIGKLP